MPVLKFIRALLAVSMLGLHALSGPAQAEPPAPPPEQTPSSEDEIRAALFGGVPGD